MVAITLLPLAQNSISLSEGNQGLVPCYMLVSILNQNDKNITQHCKTRCKKQN